MKLLFLFLRLRGRFLDYNFGVNFYIVVGGIPNNAYDSVNLGMR